MNIDERAKAYHNKIIERNPQAEAYNFAGAYKQGANDQYEEDMRKVCKFAEVIYDFFNLEEREINREKFIEGFKGVLEDGV